jgi:osmoprotectant transport system substrate-binding protein
MNKKLLIVLSILLVSALCLTACGKTDITIGAETYTEQKILSEMYKALIEQDTDLSVKIKTDLAAAQVEIDALKNNDIQIGYLYSGEVFNNHFPITVKNHDRAQVLKAAQEGFKEHFGFKYYDSFGFENTYGFAVRKDVADKDHLQKVSDLAAYAKDMVLGVDTTWLERGDDGYEAFKKEYGFSFKDPHPMDINLVYGAIANKQVDIVLAYTTDPRIQADNLVVLQDDKSFFPPYDASPATNEKTLEKYPQLDAVIQKLVGKIDTKTMVDLNYKVDIEKKTPKQVAMDFLKEKGLLK